MLSINPAEGNGYANGGPLFYIYPVNYVCCLGGGTSSICGETIPSNVSTCETIIKNYCGNNILNDNFVLTTFSDNYPSDYDAIMQNVCFNSSNVTNPVCITYML